MLLIIKQQVATALPRGKLVAALVVVTHHGLSASLLWAGQSGKSPAGCHMSYEPVELEEAVIGRTCNHSIAKVQYIEKSSLMWGSRGQKGWQRVNECGNERFWLWCCQAIEVSEVPSTQPEPLSPLSLPAPIWHEEGESATLQDKRGLQFRQANSYCLSTKNPHDFTLQICLPLAIDFCHCEGSLCSTDTVKTMQHPSTLWLHKDWRLCPGNIHGEDVHGSVSALCVCIEIKESWKIPFTRAQSRPLPSPHRSALERTHTQRC
ncbi:hypothetical protein MHYP_G00111780 [Metynnis hypsauchen]